MSYHLLEPEAQRFFARMGVFGGVDFGVTAAAAQVEEREAERTLERLRHLALAQPSRRAGRYALHPLLRDYACAHLDDQDAYRRMAAHYLAVAEEAGSKLTGGEIKDGLAVLDEEISNIRAGQAWAVGSEREAACELVRDYIHAMARYFSLRAHWDEWIEWSQAGLQACEELGNEHGAGVISGNLGLVYADKGEWERAIEFYQKSLETEEKVGDIHGMAQTYGNLGNIYQLKGEWERAIKFYQRALSTMEKVDDIHGIAGIWGNPGFLYEAQGEYERALNYLERSLEMLKKIGAHEAAEVEEEVRRVRGKVAESTTDEEN